MAINPNHTCCSCRCGMPFSPNINLKDLHLTPNESPKIQTLYDKAREIFTNSVDTVQRTLSSYSIQLAPAMKLLDTCQCHFKVLQDGLDTHASAFEKALASKFNDLKKFAGWDEFNTAMSKKLDSHWLSKFINSLAQLPINSAKKIATQFYNQIKAILQAIVHPLEGKDKLAKLVLNLMYTLTKAETWTLMGTGMLGASLGTAVVGNPISVIGLTIGAAATIGGLTFGAVKAAHESYKTTDAKYASTAALAAVAIYLKDQSFELPQAFSDGLVTGLVMGGVQKLAKKFQSNNAVFDPKKIINESDRFDPTKHSPKEYIDRYIAQRGLPKEYSGFAIDKAGGHIHIYYEKPSHLASMQANPKIAELVKNYANDPSHKGFKPINVEVVLGPKTRVAIHAHKFRYAGAPAQYDVGAWHPTKFFTIQKPPVQASQVIEKMTPVMGAVTAVS